MVEGTQARKQSALNVLPVFWIFAGLWKGCVAPLGLLDLASASADGRTLLESRLAVRLGLAIFLGSRN